MSKTAIITGCPGQDSYYLVNHLLAAGYKVIGTYRYSSTDFQRRFDGFQLDNPNFSTYCLDITDASGCNELVDKYKPDELYNLAAASHVGESFKNPRSVFSINCGAVINLLEAVRRFSPSTRFLHAGTSEQWGSNYSTDENGVKYQDEQTPFCGNSPYAVSKIAAFEMVRLYRNSYNLFTCSTLCHNHESPRRSENFVTRKITKYIARLYFTFVAVGFENLEFNEENIVCKKSGRTFPKLRLGNIEAVRDWSHAEDFMRGMHLVLSQDYPDDYVLSSGQGRSVRDFLEHAFGLVNIDNFTDFIFIDPEFYRPCEVEFLQGRSTKIREKLGWEPHYTFSELVSSMVKNDLQIASKEAKSMWDLHVEAGNG